MPLADKISPAPREVRLAGALTALPGLTLMVMAVMLLIGGLTGRTSLGNSNVYAEAGFYAVLGIGVLFCAGGLLFGQTWARSPSVVVALTLAGVGWYTAGPSGFPVLGVPIIVVGLAVVVLLFRRPSRAWVLDLRDGETEEEAAERDGAEGRAARRGQDESQGT
ncbi:hypothetical protein [Amycolatopsis suaedae]|uniref:Integral membrane protein n=1 Tax=Amycolatopsis suaedae TaxID=2510978 RepID=A0A4Q7J069_9PSEU|nr:hypothetical protein [Amycolatopsis suaedae]RZQ60730.1 hypothetical protein EWH70_26815 [Amycolatopsis suaedae]